MRDEVINQPSAQRFLRSDVRPNSANTQFGQVPIWQNSKQFSLDDLLLVHASGELPDTEADKHRGFGGIYGVHLNAHICRAKPDHLRASLNGVDALLLVSGMDTLDARIQQHRNVIEAAKAAGVRKIVYTGIQGGEEGTAFPPSHKATATQRPMCASAGLAC